MQAKLSYASYIIVPSPPPPPPPLLLSAFVWLAKNLNRIPVQDFCRPDALLVTQPTMSENQEQKNLSRMGHNKLILNTTNC